MEISPAAFNRFADQTQKKTHRKGSPEKELSPEEDQRVQELKKRDREVRAHEQAHVAALGPHGKGGAQYEFQVGPDGQRYAVGGEVPVEVSPGKDPQATLQKAQAIQQAALAPADPSGADRAAAAKAAQMAGEARKEVQGEKSSDGNPSKPKRLSIDTFA